MKIVQVTRQFYPAIGGIENVVLELSRALISLGYEVHVVTLDRLWGQKRHLDPEELFEGIYIHRIPYWGSRRYAIAPKVLSFIKSGDLVHLHSADFFLDYLSFTKRFHNKPIILSSHGIFFHTPFLRELKELYFQTFTKKAIAQVEAVICDSHQDEERIKKISALSKVRVIPNGVHFPNGNQVCKDRNLILSIGRLFQNKRFDRLISTFSILVKENPGLRLVIIGEDQGEKANLERQIDSLGLQNRVILLGQVDEKTKWDYLSKAYIFALASEYESFGVAVVEAMVAGCVPILSNLPAFEQFFNNTYKEFMVDYDDSLSVKETFLKVLRLSDGVSEEISNKFRSIGNEYTWDAIARKFDQLYVEVLKPQQAL